MCIDEKIVCGFNCLGAAVMCTVGCVHLRDHNLEYCSVCVRQMILCFLSVSAYSSLGIKKRGGEIGRVQGILRGDFNCGPVRSY